jgi:hypothetical protein
MNAPNTCFIPLVAGPLLYDLPSIFRKIDSLGQEMQKIPYAVFVLGLQKSMELDISRHHMSPAVVSILGREKDTYFYFNITRVTVKVKADGSPNTIFYFQCQGNSSHSQKLLLKDGQVNREIAEVYMDLGF